PFRMTEENLARHADSKWYGFWQNLKQAYDAFEVSRAPPAIGVCGTSYVVAPADPSDGHPEAAGMPSDACDTQPPIVTSSNPPPKTRRFAAKARLAGSHTQRSILQRSARTHLL